LLSTALSFETKAPFFLSLLLLLSLNPFSSPLSPKTGKRCFVGNLAWRTSWQDLKDKFREVGTVVYANVMRDDGGTSKFKFGKASFFFTRKFLPSFFVFSLFFF